MGSGQVSAVRLPVADAWFSSVRETLTEVCDALWKRGLGDSGDSGPDPGRGGRKLCRDMRRHKGLCLHTPSPKLLYILAINKNFTMQQMLPDSYKIKILPIIKSVKSHSE